MNANRNMKSNVQHHYLLKKKIKKETSHILFFGKELYLTTRVDKMISSWKFHAHRHSVNPTTQRSGAQKNVNLNKWVPEDVKIPLWVYTLRYNWETK